MNIFDNLSQEKRERIINAAMSVFATHGYHKTSAADIAKAAEISKAMVFTYFGTKRGCYEFMCDEMLRISIDEFHKVKEKLLSVADYFDRIILSVTNKIGVLKQRPALFSFAVSVFTERDEEVRTITNRILSEAYCLTETFLSTDIDATKFMNTADAARVSKMAEWLTQGCIDEWSRSGIGSLDNILADFIACMTALKNHFYKEEYL